MIYLDNSATTKAYKQVTDEYVKINEECFFNPSALYTAAIDAEKTVENARKRVSLLMGKKRDNIYFTSGGTESDNIAVLGAALAYKKKGNHIITTTIEHKAVLKSCEFLQNLGFEVTYIGTDEYGVVDLEALENAITDKTVLISVMLVNNETGVIQPINKIKDLAGNIIVHTDAVQAFGKVSLKDINADLISVSSHKIHGPKGVGALYISDDAKVTTTVLGGGQEKGIRSGTLNVPAISGFGIACEIADDNFEANREYLKNLRDYCAKLLVENIDNVVINGNSSPVNIISASFEGVRGEVLLHTLETKEIYLSTGSACNSKNTKTSYVIDALGLDRKYAEGTVRISLSVLNTKEEIDIAVNEIKNAVIFLRKFKRR